jgi:DNA-directed RNA polymerase I, II, and III subunit RPABC2
MNEKYGDDDEYDYDDEKEVESKPNKKKQGDASDIDDSDDDENASKQSDDSDEEEGEVSEDDDDDTEDDDARNKRLFTKDKTSESQLAAAAYPGSEDDDEDDEDDYDENYLQKFDETLKQNIISEYHPEMQQLNYNEVELLTTIHRDEQGQIYDPLHRTLPFLTKFEKARVLGERAKQINDGAKPFVKLTTNAIDGYLIALAELEQKAIPFIIKRPLPNGGCEYWKLKDLEILI